MHTIALCLVMVSLCLVSSNPFYSIDSEDGGPSVELDQVSIRRISSADLPPIPVNLLPIPRRRTGPPNAMPAYNLIWLPGGAIKVLPRSMARR